MTVQIRDAQVGDIPHLAYVCMQASGGVYEAIYEGAIPGRETHLIIEHIFSRLNASSSFRHCRIVELEGEVVGGLHAFSAETAANDPPDPLVGRDRLEVLAPFVALHVPEASYYVSSIGFYTTRRGQGYGRQLMQEAEKLARSEELQKMSLHVFEENRTAVTLYKNLGFEEIGRSPAVPHPLIRYDGDVLLLVKDL